MASLCQLYPIPAPTISWPRLLRSSEGSLFGDEHRVTQAIDRVMPSREKSEAWAYELLFREQGDCFV